MESDSDPSTTDLLDPKNEEGWEDVEPDVEDQTFKSLFEDKWFGDITQMFKYDKEKHGFEFVKLKNQLKLDSLDRVQLINFVRSEVKADQPLPKVWDTALFEDEQYLKPTLQDDAVLYSLDDIDISAFGTETALNDSEQEIQELRERLAQLQIQFAAYREEVQVSFQNQLNSIKEPSATPKPNGHSFSSSSSSPEPTTTTSSQEDQDSGYFTSYSHNTIHESMLKDTIRTSAYRDFIYDHKHLFAGKTVLDVGCGTAILSLFCARAGAARVLAVDNSSIIDKARVIVYENGYQDVITCLRGKMEAVHLPVERVDIIISEWMGYGLLYESMLDSVLWARDRYLNPETGLMVPSHASLRITPLIDSDLRISHLDFWKDVYGFNMGSMLDAAVYDEALVRLVANDHVPDDDATTTTSFPFLNLNLHTAQTSDLTFLLPFSIPWPGSAENQPLDGWALYFDIFFLRSRTESLKPPLLGSHASSSDDAVVAARGGQNAFSTGPAAPETHWQQVALLARKQEWGGWRAGDLIRGMVGYRRKEGRGRSVDIEVIWEREREERGGGGGGEEEREKGKRRQVWTLD